MDNLRKRTKKVRQSQDFYIINLTLADQDNKIRQFNKSESQHTP